MVSLRRIVRDYTDAGSLNGLLAIWGFVAADVFITKAGEIGVVYRVAGVDYEGCEHAARRQIVHQFESAVRLLDERDRLYQYLLKRRVDPFESAPCANPIAADALQRRTDDLNRRRADLYRLDLYAVLLSDGVKASGTSSTIHRFFQDPKAALRAYLDAAAVTTVLEDELHRAVERLRVKATAFEVGLADRVKPTRLGKADAYRFLRQLVNYEPHIAAGAALRYDTHVDYFVADSEVTCHRDHLEVGRAHVKLLAMKEPPAATFPHMLEPLYAVPGEFIACLEWRRVPTDRMRRDLKARRRHFFNSRVSMQNYLIEGTRPEEMLVDTSADAVVAQLGDAMTQMEVDGHVFGECSLTLVLHDQDARSVERAAADAITVMATHDGAFIDETYNVLNAWLAIMPGNHAHNLRRLAILDANLADLSFLFTLERGDERSAHLGRPAMAVFETQHASPYFWNLHVQDVGHTLVLGSTGKGKSFLLNFLLTAAQQYDPFTVIFDMGHSYRKLSTLLEGSYVELGAPQSATRLNPFVLEPTPEHLHFLAGFVRVLLEGRGSAPLSADDETQLYRAIERLYLLDPDQHRLYSLIHLVPRHLRRRLETWIEGGRYGWLFDHVDDTLSMHRLQVFEFGAMGDFPELLEALLFYVLHRVSAHIAERHGLTLCVLDEAWRFIQHPTLRAYVQDALKTWRKANASMILATQAVGDFAQADLLRTVVDSCPTKLLLGHTAFDRAQYAELLQLNPMELDRLAGLHPPTEFLLKRPDITKVLRLNVDPTSYWLYTNNAQDNDRFRAAVESHGFAGGLQVLAASR